VEWCQGLVTLFCEDFDLSPEDMWQMLVPEDLDGDDIKFLPETPRACPFECTDPEKLEFSWETLGSCILIPSINEGEAALDYVESLDNSFKQLEEDYPQLAMEWAPKERPKSQETITHVWFRRVRRILDLMRRLLNADLLLALRTGVCQFRSMLECEDPDSVHLIRAMAANTNFWAKHRETYLKRAATDNALKEKVEECKNDIATVTVKTFPAVCNKLEQWRKNEPRRGRDATRGPLPGENLCTPSGS
jgi:hypothetical protein